MIHVILRGRLGNWLFQYAIGKKLALTHNTGLCLNLSNRLSIRDWTGSHVTTGLSHFNISAQFSRSKPLFMKACHYLGVGNYLRTGVYFREKKWGFDPDGLLLPDQTYLFGYFQSEKYFQDIAPLLRQDLRLIAFPNDQASLAVEEKIARTNSVSLTVRRGDYLKSALLNVCNLNYYWNAVNFMHTRLDAPHFFVFSDDIDWCKVYMKIENCDFVDLPLSRKHPINDFRLISKCKHHIIANSTFSWWAAWLSDNPAKIVVTPNKWFNDEALNRQALQDTVPANWVRIDF